ncbi:MAG: short-chain collagen C4-like, partial [Elusimicrobia bacterium]
MAILRMKRDGALAALLWIAALAPAGAVPPGFNIQGRLTDANGVNREGDCSIKFTLYDAPTGGTALWTRTYSALTVSNGNFQTVLGDTAGQPMLSDVFAAGDARHLEIQVLSGPGITSPETPLAPRQQLVSVPFAFRAGVAEALTKAAGIVYTRWGRTVCPAGASLLYAGYVAGGYFNHPGSGGAPLCLSDAPTWDEFADTSENGALLYGTEFETGAYGAASLRSLQNFKARCAVCYRADASVSFMLPGSQQCPSGWTPEYAGYLMSNHYTHPAANEFSCVDRA